MRAGILTGTLLFSSAALSQEGPYVGLGLGVFDYEENIVGPTFSFADRAPIYKLYGGYRFGDRWAVEGYYGTTSGLKDEVFPAFPVRAEFDIIEVRGLRYFGPFLAGIGYSDMSLSVSPRQLTGPTNDPDYSVILGGEWSRNDWNFRVEAEAFETDRASHAASLSIVAQFRFGRR